MTEQRTCECGCGGTPKQGRFLPGHDAVKNSKSRYIHLVLDSLIDGEAKQVRDALFAMAFGEGREKVITSGAYDVYTHYIEYHASNITNMVANKAQRRKTNMWSVQYHYRNFLEGIRKAQEFITKVEAGEVTSGTMVYLRREESQDAP